MNILVTVTVTCLFLFSLNEVVSDGLFFFFFLNSRSSSCVWRKSTAVGHTGCSNATTETIMATHDQLYLAYLCSFSHTFCTHPDNHIVHFERHYLLYDHLPRNDFNYNPYHEGQGSFPSQSTDLCPTRPLPSGSTAVLFPHVIVNSCLFPCDYFMQVNPISFFSRTK